MRSEPDPTIVSPTGSAPAVREVVRINHLRNCVLCHAPAPANDVAPFIEAASQTSSLGLAAAKWPTLPLGQAPVFGLPLPVTYYQGGPDDVFVRADFTYLRQDFSLMLDVESAAPWPKMQRFDFLVRTRALTPSEIAARPAPTTFEKSANGPALLFVLSRLGR